MNKSKQGLRYSLLSLLVVFTVVAIDLILLRILNSFQLLNGGVRQVANLGACLFALILQLGWIMIAARNGEKRQWWIGFQKYGFCWIVFAVLMCGLFGYSVQHQLWNVYKSGFFGAISSRTMQTSTGLVFFLGIPVVGVALGILGGRRANSRTLLPPTQQPAD